MLGAPATPSTSIPFEVPFRSTVVGLTTENDRDRLEAKSCIHKNRLGLKWKVVKSTDVPLSISAFFIHSSRVAVHLDEFARLCRAGSWRT